MKVLEITSIDTDSYSSIIYSLPEVKIDAYRLIAKKVNEMESWYFANLFVDLEELETGINKLLS